MTEFVFPFKFEDILEESSDARYAVPFTSPNLPPYFFQISSRDQIENMDEKRIEKKLEAIEREFNDSWANIKDHANFDFLFYFIKYNTPKVTLL